MFKWFKKKSKKQNQISITLNNNDVIIVNGKKYLVGFGIVNDNIFLHDIDKYT